MTRPISGSQLKRLTRRLRDGTETPEDLHTLADILIYYRQVGTRADQDDVVARIAARLLDSSRPAKIIDRRLDPRAGYRAVHLEIRREGILLEVQVRTALQHQWTELFERTADRLGRGLRYGEPVQLTPEAATFLRALDETASMIDAVEADITSTDPSVRSVATTAQKQVVHALDTANHYLEQLPRPT